MKLYKNNAEKVIKIVTMPEFEADTFGHDLANMLKARRTFDEVINDVSLGAMVRNRFKIMQRQIFGELGKDPAQVLLHGY